MSLTHDTHYTSHHYLAAPSPPPKSSTCFDTNPTHKPATTIEHPPSNTAFMGFSPSTLVIKTPNPEDRLGTTLFRSPDSYHEMIGAPYVRRMTE